MARGQVLAQRPTLGGVNPSRITPTVDHIKFANNGSEFLLVENASGGALTVTIKVPPSRTVYGSVIPDRTYNIPNNEFRLLGPFPPSLFRRAEGESGGDPYMTYVDFSAQAGVKVSVISHG